MLKPCGVQFPFDALVESGNFCKVQIMQIPTDIIYVHVYFLFLILFQIRLIKIMTICNFFGTHTCVLQDALV